METTMGEETASKPIRPGVFFKKHKEGGNLVEGTGPRTRMAVGHPNVLVV